MTTGSPRGAVCKCCSRWNAVLYELAENGDQLCIHCYGYVIKLEHARDWSGAR